MKSQFPYKFGWNSYFENQLKNSPNAAFEIGRISAENKNNYLIWSQEGELSGEVTGKLLYNSKPSSLPKVGDWVLITIFKAEAKAIIHEVLERQTKFSRKVAGKQVEEQVIATNLDKLFIVTGLDNNFNIPRIYRYFVQAEQEGLSSYVVLTKADINYAESNLSKIFEYFGYDRVIVTSSVTGEGIDKLTALLNSCETVAFVGSSGVGKSTLINMLTGEASQKMAEVRTADSKGKHITTRREMLIMKTGAILIDTPGMREFHLWKDDEAPGGMFSEIEVFAENCRYRNCTHQHEKGCAVIQAVEAGDIPQKIYDGYLKLRKEMEFLEGKDDIYYQIKKKNEWKQIHKSMKNFKKRN